MKEMFSVIVLSYNNSQYLKGCLDSIFKQTYPNIEIIVADDCSNSFDEEEFRNYCAQKKGDNIKRIIFLKNKVNLGTVKNINNAIRESRGSFFKLIGADDELAESGTLENAAECIKNSPYGIITSDVIKCDAEMKIIGMYSNRLQKRLNSITAKECFIRLCIHNDIVAGGVFFSKLFIEKNGYFDERYRLLEDWPMWLRITYNGIRFAYYPFNAIKYRSDVGFGTSINQVYMKDKKSVFINEIKTRKKNIGCINYLLAKISFKLINSIYVRKIYGIIKRRGKTNV